MRPVLSEWFGKQLVEAGVISAEELNGISRIVIDCTAGEAVQVYVQRFGDKDALARLAPMLGGMLPGGDQTAEAGSLAPGGD